MLYAIYAYENIYGGYHGMNERFIAECDSYEEAESIATEASYQVMEDYLDVKEELEYQISDERLFESDEEYEEYLEELMAENVAYEIYKIKEEYSNEDIETLNNRFYNLPEEFISVYCEKI